MYKLTEIAVWRDYKRFSGLSLKFEVPAEYTGYPPIVETVGSTRLASFYTVIENAMTHFPYSYVMGYNDENDGGLSELNLGYSVYIVSDKGTNITSTWGHFGSNLIGAYAVLGASRDGTI